MRISSAFPATSFGIIMTTLVSSSLAAEPPATLKKAITEDFHGTKVIDDYRWL